MSFDTRNSSTSQEERYFYDSDSDSYGSSHDENIQIRSDVNGIDGFYQHIVLPTDTLQGICLQYKISSSKLKQVNRFSGSSLILAPKILNIPKQEGVSSLHQNTESNEYKIHYIHAKYPALKVKDIKQYLEKYDWSLMQTLKCIQEELVLRQQRNTYDIDSFKTRNRMVNGITKEIPLSFFGQALDMNSSPYTASGFVNACLGMDYGDIEMKEWNTS